VIIHTGCGHSFDPQADPRLQQRFCQVTWDAAIALLAAAVPGTLYGACRCLDCLTMLALVRTGDERIIAAPTAQQYLAAREEEADGVPAEHAGYGRG
jgi:hypothetical protein